jgi:hypothetical protein
MANDRLPQRIKFLGRVLERSKSRSDAAWHWCDYDSGASATVMLRRSGQWGAWYEVGSAELVDRDGDGVELEFSSEGDTLEEAKDALRRKLRRVRDELAGLEL